MIRYFKIIALLEGTSLLILLLIAMPLKYIFQMPILVKIVGMAHGVLFIAYIILAIILTRLNKWSVKKSILIYLASVVPLGTFYVEKKILNDDSI